MRYKFKKWSVALMIIICLLLTASPLWAKDKAKKSASVKVVVTLKDGSQKKLIEYPHGSHDLKAAGFQLTLHYPNFKRISPGQADNSLEVVLADGRKISGQGRLQQIKAVWEFGSFLIEPGKIKSIEIVSPQPRSLSNTKTVLKLKSRQGLTLDVEALDVNLGAFDWPLPNRAKIDSLTYSPDKKTLMVGIGKNPVELRLPPQTTISGYSGLGFARIQVADLTELSLVRAGKADQTPKHSSGTIVRCIDEQGNTLQVSLFQDQELFDLFDIFFPVTSFQSESLLVKGLSILNRAGVRHLVKDPLSFPSRIDGRKLTFDLLDGRQVDGYVDSLHKVRGTCQIGEIGVRPSALKKIEPLFKRHAVKSLLRGKIEIKTRDGKNYVGRMVVLNMANKIRRGYRLVGGGRLFRLSSRQVPLRLNDGQDVLISFDKLKAIQVDPDYNKNGRITVTSKQGNQLSGKVDLTKVKKPAKETYAADEGLALEISSDYWIFAPLTEVKSVTLND